MFFDWAGGQHHSSKLLRFFVDRQWWFKLFFVVTAMMLGTWIPLRLLYFGERMPIDNVVDILTLALIVAHYSYRYSSQKENPDEEVRFSKSMILSDLLIAIPFDVILFPVLGPGALPFMLLKILILKHLTYVRKLLDAFASLHPIVYRLVPVVLFMPMLVHLVACLWIHLGSGTAVPDGSSLNEYIRGIYWTFTTLTTVGYGDIAARTPVQMLLACFVQILGVGVFGFILSNVASMLGRLDAARDHHLEILDRVETYMRYNHLPPQLRGRVRAYYRYIWETHRGYDDSEVLGTLPDQLRGEVALEINRTIIDKVPLLSGVDQDVIQDIVRQLKPHVCVPGEKVFHIDEPGDSMYFIHAGEVEIVSREGQILNVLKSGHFFGEMALLTNQPRNATVRAKGYCDLFVLSRESFEQVAHRYPDFEKQIHQTASTRSSIKVA